MSSLRPDTVIVTVIAIMISVSLQACHLMSPNDLFENQPETSNDSLTICQVQSTDQQGWWQGEWELDTQSLTQAAIMNLGTQENLTAPIPSTDKPTDPSIKLNELLETDLQTKTLAQDLSISLAHAIQIKVSAQQAHVQVDQMQYRLATSPLPNDQGVRLVGTRGTSLLWCEQNRIFWSFDQGQAMPIKRKH
jgi:hypothetical protein